MGRANPLNLAFLVRRPDTGHLVSHRKMPVRWAPFIVGDLSLSWSVRSYALKGQGTIKISLGTTDARQGEIIRRDEIHAALQPTACAPHAPNPVLHHLMGHDPALLRAVAGTFVCAGCSFLAATYDDGLGQDATAHLTQRKCWAKRQTVKASRKRANASSSSPEGQASMPMVPR